MPALRTRHLRGFPGCFAFDCLGTVDTCITLLGVVLRPLVSGSHLFDAGFTCGVQYVDFLGGDFQMDAVFSSLLGSTADTYLCPSTEAWGLREGGPRILRSISDSCSCVNLRSIWKAFPIFSRVCASVLSPEEYENWIFLGYDFWIYSCIQRFLVRQRFLLLRQSMRRSRRLRSTRNIGIFLETDFLIYSFIQRFLVRQWIQFGVSLRGRAGFSC